MSNDYSQIIERFDEARKLERHNAEDFAHVWLDFLKVRKTTHGTALQDKVASIETRMAVLWTKMTENQKTIIRQIISYEMMEKYFTKAEK
jgi:hypothetical protein